MRKEESKKLYDEKDFDTLFVEKWHDREQLREQILLPDSSTVNELRYFIDRAVALAVAAERLKYIPKERRTIRYIQSCIDYEEHDGVHTYHQCECGRSRTRSSYCSLCWKDILEVRSEQIKKEKSDHRDNLRRIGERGQEESQSEAEKSC